MKTCCKCKKNKSLSEFQKNCSQKDGRQNHCKGCRRIYQQNSEKHKAYQKKYYVSEKSKGRVRYRKSRKEKDKNKTRARNIIGHAIRDGKILPAQAYVCECGEQAAMYHHYNGYAKENAFEVTAMCYSCHNDLHRKKKVG